MTRRSRYAWFAKCAASAASTPADAGRHRRVREIRTHSSQFANVTTRSVDVEVGSLDTLAGAEHFGPRRRFVVPG